VKHGPQLRDPKKLLLGSGKQTRFVRLEAARQLAHRDVEALIVAAIDHARFPCHPKGRADSSFGHLLRRIFSIVE
jgi:hypothetical protein